MGCWSPLDAMNAYVRTLQLCKEYSNNTTNKLLEPECIEFISALAAGNRAQRMVAVTSDGSSPSTLALAIAARCTGGRLVCVGRDREALNQTKSQIEELELGDVVSFKVGVDPREVMKQYKNIDFAVVDHRMEVTRIRNSSCRSRGSERSTFKKTFLVFVRNETKHRYML